MNFIETAIHFDCAGERLLGIVSAPTASQAQAKTGVVIIVGGPQYRAGSHRQFVTLARTLAQAGYPVLRFDCRGMGDSTGEIQTFENISEDIAAAITALQKGTGVKSVALWGLCDGASAALLYLHARPDSRVLGLTLTNPWVRSQAGLERALAKHYYWRRLRGREFWAKLLCGKVASSAGMELLRNLRTLLRVRDPKLPLGTQGDFQDQMALALEQFTGHTLVLLSENDLTAQEFSEYTARHPKWSSLMQRSLVERHALSGADHTFTDQHASKLLIDKCLAWLRTISPA
jgi:exosortase A-associated hydrolase 1